MGSYSPEKYLSDNGLSFENALDAAYLMCRKIMLDRHRKYGPNNIAAGGLPGVMVREQDKLARAWHMLGLDALAEYENIWDAADSRESPGNANDETLDDTLVDIVNYGLISILLRNNMWGLPFADELNGGQR